jgi:hypothetical protein
VDVKQIKELINTTNDLRKITKENDGIRITDLYDNGNDKLIIEQYAVFTKSDLERQAQEDKEEAITLCTLNKLLNKIKMWHTNEDDENFIVDLEYFFENYDIKDTSNLLEESDNNIINYLIDDNVSEIIFKFKY